jgi:hypothetical protein
VAFQVQKAMFSYYLGLATRALSRNPLLTALLIAHRADGSDATSLASNLSRSSR